MAGPTYAASVTVATTALNSLAADNSTGYPLIGVFTPLVSNATLNYLDYIYSGQFTTSASAVNRQAGYVYVYLIFALNGTPTWPAVATGTIGTDVAGSFVDSEERDSACILLDAIPVDTTPSSVVYLKPKSLLAAFGGLFIPSHHCLFISTNATTTTTAGLAASGNAIYYTPIVTP